MTIRLTHCDFEKFLDGREWTRYTWGEIVEVFHVGVYGIVKYIPRSGDKSPQFHPFIFTDENKEHHNNEFYWMDTSTSYSTLESALVGAIGCKFDGHNSQASHYFCKMVGIKI